MVSVIYFWPDVNPEEAWKDHVNYVPTQFARLTSNGVDPELAADLADDGRPVCHDPPKIAADGEEVAEEWQGMYEAVA